MTFIKKIGTGGLLGIQFIISMMKKVLIGFGLKRLREKVLRGILMVVVGGNGNIGFQHDQTKRHIFC